MVPPEEPPRPEGTPRPIVALLYMSGTRDLALQSALAHTANTSNKQVLAQAEKTCKCPSAQADM